jgi:murein peptide amidase A
MSRDRRPDRRPGRTRAGWAAATAAGALLTPLAVASVPAPSYAGGPGRPAVVAKRVIGHTVQGRPIRAWRLGDPGNATRVVAFATMHGDEPAPRHTLMRLRDGARIRGVDLWVVPNFNPDGLARGSRYNARGVDLNRNFPVSWRRQAHSGRRAASAPETRAVMRFLRNVRPDRVVSFHQPLHGVDTNGSKAPAFARRLARTLRLPRKNFDCGGGCHGTMTQWFNRRFAGACVTVEYGRSPRARYVNRFAPRALLRAVGGRRG